ncbi:MAG: 23S rRNA (adenine(2503)-C(2))-methyltransferase RlmN [bacterium]|nr:23S rRNA (adenine(2503)-C(2))-methyltransferase RlmN [bacterium]
MIDLDKIKALLLNAPRYRFVQIDKLLFQDLIGDWQDATTLPKNLREILKLQAPITIENEISASSDGKTTKALLTLNDSLKIETVLMGFKDRDTVCVSSQVGCPLSCTFCATGMMGYKRSLTISEIVGQAIFFARLLKKESKKVTNIVFMGMGEPFLNYNNVWGAIETLNDPSKFGLGARHISISTSGIIEGINKLSNESLEVNLAISLHAPNNDLRSRLMPINKKYPLKDLLESVGNYARETRRKVMFEYIMLDGVNDSKAEAEQLSNLLKNPLYHLNLIQYNETGIFKPSSQERLNVFKKVLLMKHISFTERFRFGTDINAACGQLAVSQEYNKKSLVH